MANRDLDRDELDPRPFPGPNRDTSSPYKFTQEELRVLKECNKDSFFQRCIPLSTLFGIGTYYGVKSGHLNRNPRYGATPKVIVAVIVGYFMGKFSYQQKCAEKLMQLPNSPIGEMLRQRRKGMYRESLEPGFGPGMSLAPFSGVNSSETYSDLEPSRSLDIDTTRPEFEGLDESHRPSVDNPIYEEEMPPVQQHTTTYEELRKRNREEYQKRRTGAFKEPPKQSLQTPTQTDEDNFKEPISTPKKNMYGDAWG